MTELYTSDIDRGVEELKIFHKFFHRFFRVGTRNVIKQSLQYQRGLLLGDKRKNMTNMEKTMPDCDTSRSRISSPTRNGTRRVLSGRFRSELSS